MTSFSSMFTLSLVGCESNKAKEAFYGSIPVGMLLSDEGVWKSITMQQLVNGARLHHQNSAEFTILEHIRDNDAMLEFHKVNTSSQVANYGDIAGEIMSYCIIDAPNRPLMVSGTTGPTAPYSPYQIQRELRINAIIYPKNDAISRSLGVHLEQDHQYVSHKRKHAKAAVNNLRALHAESPTKTWYSRAWDWVSDIDYEKWFSILKTVVPLFLSTPDKQLERPGELWQRYGECVPSDIYRDAWLENFKDPELVSTLTDFRDALTRFRNATEGKPPYLYPSEEWVTPELIVQDDLRTTYENVVKAGSSIPSMFYVPSIGWVL